MADINAEKFISAALGGNVKKIKEFIENGIDINIKYSNLDTALMIASTYGYSRLVKYLVENGADTTKMTIVEWARFGWLEKVKECTSNKVNINLKDEHGTTALIYASESGHIKVAKYLIENGANIDMVNGYYNTALMDASKEGKIIFKIREFKMKRVLITLIALLFILDCNAQKNENEMRDYWKKLESTVNKNADRNYYVISYASSGCNFEVLFNDSHLFSHFEGSNASGTYPINPLILKSGKQTITVKIYPMKGHEEKGINSRIPLSINIQYASDPNAGFDGYKSILDDFIPEVKVGIPYFEYTAEFMAEVPFELEGWSNCVDLTDEPDIKEQVIAKYKEMAQMIIDEDFRVLMNNDKRKYFEVDFSIYMTEQECIESLEEKYEQLKDFKRVKPMENYKLVFHADGRLVSLFNGGSFGFILDGEGETWVQKYFLGKRKGSDKLEVIR